MKKLICRRLAVRRWPIIERREIVRGLVRTGEPARKWRAARRAAKQAKHEKRLQEDWGYRLGWRIGTAVNNAVMRACAAPLQAVMRLRADRAGWSVTDEPGRIVAARVRCAVEQRDPARLRELATLTGAVAALATCVGALLFLFAVLGGLSSDEAGQTDPVAICELIVMVFLALTWHLATYPVTPLSDEEIRELLLREIWSACRPEADNAAWTRYVAWAQAQPTGDVEVWIVRHEPDGSIAAETFATLPGDCSAERGAGVMWDARRHAAQAELDACAAHEVARARDQFAAAARRDAEVAQQAEAIASSHAEREAADQAAADQRVRQIEAEGLAAAMRGATHTPRGR